VAGQTKLHARAALFLRPSCPLVRSQFGSPNLRRSPYHVTYTHSMSLLDRVSGVAYNAIFKRNSTFFAFIVVSAFGFEVAFDNGTRKYFETYNKGVRRL